MANKTQAHDGDVQAFLASVEHPVRRADAQAVLGRLGRHKTGKSCLYVNALADVDMEVLRELVEASIRDIRARHP